MPQNRPKLSLRLPREDAVVTADAVCLIERAIAQACCLIAHYNRDPIVLAPHILYERHGAPILDGVVVERAGLRTEEFKLGSFRVSGLHDLAMSAEAFIRLEGFAPEGERYVERVLTVIKA